jgi:hypothetical protein
VNSFAFKPGTGLILVQAEATGPFGTLMLWLVLDTGATRSLINLPVLQSLGFDPARSGTTATMATGSAVQVVPLVALTRLGALGRNRFGIPVLAHSLPVQSNVDGLLGLDFFQGEVLTIDFRAGHVILS